MIREYCYQVDTDKNLTECKNSLLRFKYYGDPIIFKVKDSSWYIAIVQEIKKDMIKIKNKYYSYKSFMQSLSNRSIEGSVNIIANSTIDADLVDDDTLKINLVPLIVKSKSSSVSRFIKDNHGNILLLSEAKILDGEYITLQFL